MKRTLKKLQKTYKLYKERSAKMDELDLAFGQDFENEVLEAELDKYYEEVYYPTLLDLVGQLKSLTGLTNTGTVIKMINTGKFDNLMNKTII